MKNKINCALAIAFEAGRWLGQVDLEEYYENEQYSKSVKDVFYSQIITMPNNTKLIGKQVIINLRSNEWREGVKKSSLEYLNQAWMFFNN
jgi:hypothetical protein